MTPKLEMFIQIPESVVKKGAASCADDPNNGFLKVLKAGAEYKAANMTPIYILDQRYQDLVVVAKETFQKKLN